MDEPVLPLARWIGEWVDHLQAGPGAGSLVQSVGDLGNRLQDVLAALPPASAVVAFALLGAWRGGWTRALACAGAIGLIWALGFGAPLMLTLGQVLIASAAAVAIGIPLGVLCGTRPAARALARPLLDLMQTMPPFVYLIPATLMFGLGLVPALISTLVFALPAMVRLTTLGVSQVDRSLIEAAATLGAPRWQVLVRVLLPAARPAIVAGASQTVMLSLSMVIVASMVGAGGLGSSVLSAIQRMDVGQGLAGGLCVVLLATAIDRLAETFGEGRTGSTA